MELQAAAFFELAASTTRARLIATDGRRRGRRSRGRSELSDLVFMDQKRQAIARVANAGLLIFRVLFPDFRRIDETPIHYLQPGCKWPKNCDLITDRFPAMQAACPSCLPPHLPAAANCLNKQA